MASQWTDDGIAVFRRALEAELERACQPRRVVPDVFDMCDEFMTLAGAVGDAMVPALIRELPDLTFKTTMPGVIHKVTINGTVQVFS